MRSRDKDIFKRIQKERDSDRLWRAKEILQSRTSQRYTLAEFELLGDVLNDMGDNRESGKYYFLSGSQKNEHLKNIQLYLDMTKNMPINNFVSQHPRSTKFLKSEEYPFSVSKILSERGYQYPSKEEHDNKEEVGCLIIGTIIVMLVITLFYFAIKGIWLSI